MHLRDSTLNEWPSVDAYFITIWALQILKNNLNNIIFIMHKGDLCTVARHTNKPAI